MTSQLAQMSPKFQIGYINLKVGDLLEQVEQARSHIDLVRTIGESNAINYYPQPHHRPIQHPKYGKISPVYQQYIYYKKELPQWEAQLKNYQQQINNLLSQK